MAELTLQHLHNRGNVVSTEIGNDDWLPPTAGAEVTIYLQTWQLKQERNNTSQPSVSAKNQVHGLLLGGDLPSVERSAKTATDIICDLCYPPSLGLMATIGAVLEGMHLLWGGKAVDCKGCENCGYTDCAHLIAQPEADRSAGGSFVSTTWYNSAVAYCTHCWCDFLLIPDYGNEANEKLRILMLNEFLIRFSGRLKVLHEYGVRHWWWFNQPHT
jgi:hypothetical protein